MATWPRARAFGAIALLAGLAACGAPQQRNALEESARYQAHARHDYRPPGPPEDPWGPYIREAAAKYDMPEQWVRSLMRVESGGLEYRNGQLTTSTVGAMGLMQVMPATYDMLRDRYNLGDDPYDPHDNIMAGVAYMREMYDIYGTPGFLAAYNAGPARLDDYLANKSPLPDETRHYVAMIGPNLRGIYPNNRSDADLMAMNQLPLNIPAGRRYSRASLFASNNRGGGHGSRRAPVEVAQLPDPQRRHGRDVQQFALIVPPSPPPSHGGFHLIQPANAAEGPLLHHDRGTAEAGGWAIQIGAFNSEDQAHHALYSAQGHAELGAARPHVSSVHQGHGVLWRARMTGMSREHAVQACQKLTRGHGNCIVLSPEAQS
jgi:cell division septation protein DedD